MSALRQPRRYRLVAALEGPFDSLRQIVSAIEVDEDQVVAAGRLAQRGRYRTDVDARKPGYGPGRGFEDRGKILEVLQFVRQHGPRGL